MLIIYRPYEYYAAFQAERFNRKFCPVLINKRCAAAKSVTPQSICVAVLITLLAGALDAVLTGGRRGAESREPAIVIIALGDSLTAGYGLGPGDGFVPQLQAALRRAATMSRSAMAAYQAIQARAGWRGLIGRSAPKRKGHF